MRPICSVAMPFGKKKDETGRTIDFDAVYDLLIHPAIDQADLHPLRYDEELIGGTIHKSVLERLMLSPFAVVDLTSTKSNVFYGLGMRHGIRPRSTVVIAAEGSHLPFDIGPQRTRHYHLDAGGQPDPAHVEADRDKLANSLVAAREPHEDSPFFLYVQEWPRPELDHLKADAFQERVAYTESFKQRLLAIRASRDLDAARALEAELAPMRDAEGPVVVDLFLTYRDLEAFDAMTALAAKMDPTLAGTVLVKEQLAFALNRLGRREDAKRLLEEVLERQGPSSETFGLLGRIYKDLWNEAKAAGRTTKARGLLRQAIDAYRRGFEADWRDYYPGVNAVTLMNIADDPDRHELLPVVRYATKRKLAGGNTDYWDYITLVELCVIDGDRDGAMAALPDAVAKLGQPWMARTTLGNLAFLRELREARGEDAVWIEQIEGDLRKAAPADDASS